MKNRKFLPLLQEITRATVSASKPLSVQTGTIVNGSDVQLDQQLTVTPVLSSKFTDGVSVHVEGTLNGESVSGDLRLTYNMENGDLVKVVKEEGTNIFYVQDKL